MTTPKDQPSACPLILFVCSAILAVLLAFFLQHIHEQVEDAKVRNVIHEELDKVFQRQYSPR